MVEPLDMERVTAYFDGERSVAHITYSGVLEAEDSSAAYEWLQSLIEQVGIENIRGEIFDFTEVRLFQPDNLIDAKKNSRKLNLRVNIHNTPVAMVVRDAVHREILRGPMRIVEENRRKRIVDTMDEAYAFFEEWESEDHQEPS
ncbi:MAG: hypothetical protein AAFU54_09855 [Chloroflexota bacterium]